MSARPPFVESTIQAGEMTLPVPQPRYRQLAQTLINEIRNGQYPVGSLMPTEHELCEQFGASRFTIRQAIKQLVDMGLVNRQAGVGTRVLSTQTNVSYRQVMEGIGDLRQYTADTELEILKSEMTAIGTDMCGPLGAKLGEGWLRIEALRYVLDRRAPPICFTEIYLHPAFRSVRYLGGRVSIPVYVHLEEQFGERVETVQQQIRATPLTESMAQLLNAEPGSPALWVRRSYYNHHGEIIELATSTHPTDRFSYWQTFRREWQGAPTGERAGPQTP